MLHGVHRLHRIMRQDIAHQGFQLHLTESATRALVAEQLLQAHHIGGQAIDFFLRLVDGGEPRHDLSKGVVGFLEALVQPLRYLAADLLQARVGGERQGFHRALELQRGVGHGGLDQLLIRAPLIGQGLHLLGENFFAHGIEPLLHRGRQLRQLLRHHLAQLAQALRLIELQVVHIVASEFELSGNNVALFVGSIAQHLIDAVALTGQALMQIGQHQAVLFFQHLRYRLRKILLDAAQLAHARADPHRPQNDE